jgi:N-carbamoylputrescine amidase
MSPDAPVLAVCQLRGFPDQAERNRERSFEAAERAFALGARVLVLPELIVPGYGVDVDMMSAAAEPFDGPTVSGWAEIAARHRGYVAGGFCERDGDRIFNTAVLAGPDGVLLHYRKLHLFGHEKGAFSPGDLGLPVAETELGTIGLCVCYDLRFVETVRILALRGAELILVPTAWVTGFDQLRWDDAGMAPQAHGAVLQANLNQVFIACASQAGRSAELEFLGSSLLATPRGEIAIGPLSGEREEIGVASVDMSDARRAQERGELISPRRDRRDDVYGIAIDGGIL